MYCSDRVKCARVLLIAAVVAFSFACSKDPHKLKITEQNRDSFMESIKDTKGLTADEVRMLMAYQMRSATQKAFGGTPDSVLGKTLGDIITQERKFEEKEKKEGEEQKRLAAEAAAKEQRRAEELRKALNLSVYDKSFRASDPSAGSYEDYIIIKCAYENTSGKDIRAFKGKLRFADLFGSEIFESGLTISDPVGAGQKATWVGTIKYNQFIDQDVRLKNTLLKDMKAEWLPSSIIFADGTKIGEE